LQSLRCITLAALMVLALTSCNSNTGPDNGHGPSETNTVIAAPRGNSESVNTQGAEGADANTGEGSSETVGGSNILIAYFTWADNTVVENPALIDVDAVTSASVLPPGNTGLMAQYIQEAVGADMFKITTVEPYSSDYNEALAKAIEEHGDNARPALTASVDNISDYGIIFLGFPNWWYSAPMAIFTFIDEHDLSGKTIIPFCAHGTGGLARSVIDITAALPSDVTILEAFGAYRPNVAGSQNDINDWIARLGIDD